jgi:hypothetical protein
MKMGGRGTSCFALGWALDLDASASDATTPDCADGMRIRAIRWLHPGHDLLFIKHSA